MATQFKIVATEADLDRLNGAHRRSAWEKRIAMLDEMDEIFDHLDANKAEIAKRLAAWPAKRAAAYKAIAPDVLRRARAGKLVALDNADVGRAKPARPRDPPGIGGAFLSRQLMDEAQGKIDAYWGAR